jgi:hypothetical protein
MTVSTLAKRIFAINFAHSLLLLAFALMAKKKPEKYPDLEMKLPVKSTKPDVRNRLKLTKLLKPEDLELAIDRLGLQDLIAEVVDLTHERTEQDPDNVHLVGSIGGDDRESLLVGSVAINGLAAEFGVLANRKLDPKLLETLRKRVQKMIGKVPGKLEIINCRSRLSRGSTIGPIHK